MTTTPKTTETQTPTATTAAAESAATQPLVDVIIFGGQSNMQGQSERLSECAPVAGAYEYNCAANCLRPLKNPVGENICFDGTPGWPLINDVDIPAWLEAHVLGSACYGHTNLVPEFVRAYIRETGHAVVAVHAARGSTTVAEWLPGTPYYEMLLKKSLRALKHVAEQGLTPGRVWFVWLQGESDAIFRTTRDEYKARLMALDRALKAELGIERFAVIRVGRFTNDARDDEIMAAQDEVCRDNADEFVMLTTLASELCGQPEFMHPQIGGHFSAAGLERLGAEAGQALGRLAAGNPSEG